MNEVFISSGVDEVKSPPQPVDERDIVSSTRTVFQAWYVDKMQELHTMTFNFRTHAEAWLELESRRLRGITHA